jgi:hypothetical protein
MPTPTALAHDVADDVDSRHELRDVPERVVAAIAAVRRSGWPDMYDRETVMMLAATLGHGEAAEWLVEHRHLYFIGLRKAEASLAR